MKKYAVVLMLVLAVSTAWAIEGTVTLGLNSQSWDDGSGNPGSGIGTHIGLLGSIGITPSCLPVYIGAETGFLIQSAKYSWETGFGSTDLVIKYNNVVIPILLKGTFKPTGSLHLGAGLGPSIIVHNSGSWGAESDDGAIMLDFLEDNLRTDFGFQVKGDIGIKLIPFLWLKPAFTLQINPNADDPFFADKEHKAGTETTMFFSIGLAVKP